jgi:hypothetical protein
MMKLKRCGACGSQNVSLQNVKGRTFAFKSFPRIKLLDNVMMNVCSECSNIIVGKGDSENLDSGLEKSVMLLSQKYVGKILEKMEWTQNEMAHNIGFTPVYLSELRNGKRIPEFKTFNYFKILSECPNAIEKILEDDAEVMVAESYLIADEWQSSIKEALESLKTLEKKSGPNTAQGNDYAMAA